MTHETAPSGKWITRHPALRHVAVVLEPIGQRTLTRSL